MPLNKSRILQMEADLIRMKNKEKVSDESNLKLRRELDETNLLIRLAEMLRKTVGVSQIERD